MGLTYVTELHVPHLRLARHVFLQRCCLIVQFRKDPTMLLYSQHSLRLTMTQHLMHTTSVLCRWRALIVEQNFGEVKTFNAALVAV